MKGTSVSALQYKDSPPSFKLDGLFFLTFRQKPIGLKQIYDICWHKISIVFIPEGR